MTIKTLLLSWHCALDKLILSTRGKIIISRSTLNLQPIKVQLWRLFPHDVNAPSFRKDHWKKPFPNAACPAGPIRLQTGCQTWAKRTESFQPLYLHNSNPRVAQRDGALLFDIKRRLQFSNPDVTISSNGIKWNILSTLIDWREWLYNMRFDEHNTSSKQGVSQRVWDHVARGRRSVNRKLINNEHLDC